MHTGKPHMTPGLTALIHDRPRHPRGPVNFVGLGCLFGWFGFVVIGGGSGGDNVLGFVAHPTTFRAPPLTSSIVVPGPCVLPFLGFLNPLNQLLD